MALLLSWTLKAVIIQQYIEPSLYVVDIQENSWTLHEQASLGVLFLATLL